jgi:hypothetical protein
MRRLVPGLVAVASSGCAEPADDAFVFADPTAVPEPWTAGGPARTFSEGELWQACAALEGGPEDLDHHNLVMPYRGALVLPWASEWGMGGLSLFDVSDPCAPSKLADSYAESMRETHAIGFVHLPDDDPHAGDWAVVNQQHGVMFWDLSDPAAPVEAAVLEIDGLFWPDAYARVALSVFWQYPWVFLAAADSGLYVIDATDPTAPELVTHHVFEPGLRAGGVFVVGSVALVSGAEQSAAVLLDVSDPANPMPITRFDVTDSAGEPREMYHANLVGSLALFTRKEGAGGIVLYDVSDPRAPARLGEGLTAENGGYVFYDEGLAFVGDTHVAEVFDVADPTEPVLVGTADLAGDLDTNVPFGNVMVISVDDEAEDDISSAVVPFTTAVDVTPPAVLRIDPPDGATGVALGARIGVAFDEPVEPSSVFAGSIRLYAEDGTPVRGWGSGQEVTASYSPEAPLRAGTTYTLHVMAGGIRDVNGNAVAETVTATFSTVEP